MDAKISQSEGRVIEVFGETPGRVKRQTYMTVEAYFSLDQHLTLDFRFTSFPPLVIYHSLGFCAMFKRGE